MAIASRLLGVPVRWTEDRGEHLLGGLDGDRAHERGEAAFEATAACSACGSI